jgi:hypothetical protein
MMRRRNHHLGGWARWITGVQMSLRDKNKRTKK